MPLTIAKIDEILKGNSTVLTYKSKKSNVLKTNQDNIHAEIRMLDQISKDAVIELLEKPGEEREKEKLVELLETKDRVWNKLLKEKENGWEKLLTEINKSKTKIQNTADEKRGNNKDLHELLEKYKYHPLKFWVSKSPCLSCDQSLQRAYKKSETKPTIYIAGIYEGNSKEEEYAHFIELCKIFVVEPWDLEEECMRSLKGSDRMIKCKEKKYNTMKDVASSNIIKLFTEPTDDTNKGSRELEVLKQLGSLEKGVKSSKIITFFTTASLSHLLKDYDSTLASECVLKQLEFDKENASHEITTFFESLSHPASADLAKKYIIKQLGNFFDKKDASGKIITYFDSPSYPLSAKVMTATKKRILELFVTNCD